MNKRRQAIADMVNQLGEVTLSHLKSSFPEVSEVTLRNDLRYLDEAQQLIRIHGGAKSIRSVAGSQNNYSVRAKLHQSEKALIAAKASSLISPGDSVFITAGTTCAALARKLPSCPLYIFTDGVGTLLDIPANPEYSIELFGGSYDPNIMRIHGPSVIQEIDTLHFNIAFIDTTGFHPKYGFSCLTSNVAESTGKVIEHSDKVVMLMDSSKLNYSVSPRIIPPDRIDVLVTDDQLETEIIKLLQDRGIQVL